MRECQPRRIPGYVAALIIAARVLLVGAHVHHHEPRGGTIAWDSILAEAGAAPDQDKEPHGADDRGAGAHHHDTDHEDDCPLCWARLASGASLPPPIIPLGLPSGNAPLPFPLPAAAPCPGNVAACFQPRAPPRADASSFVSTSDQRGRATAPEGLS